MPLKRGAGFYFSPTHTTQKVVRAVLEGAGLPQAEWDVTLPESRRSAAHPVPQGMVSRPMDVLKTYFFLS